MKRFDERRKVSRRIYEKIREEYIKLLEELQEKIKK